MAENDGAQMHSILLEEREKLLVTGAAASDFLLQHFSHQGFIKPAGQGGKEWLRIRHGNS